jgi:hypothetical protein
MPTLRRRSFTRIAFLATVFVAFRYIWSSSSSSVSENEIQKHNVLDLVSRDNKLDVRRHKFLQSRMGRNERDDMMSDIVANGVDDYWERFQKP